MSAGGSSETVPGRFAACTPRSPQRSEAIAIVAATLMDTSPPARFKVARPKSFVPIQDSTTIPRIETPQAPVPIGPPLARPVPRRFEPARSRDRADPRGFHTRRDEDIALPRPRRHTRSLSYGDAQLRPPIAAPVAEGPVTLAPECLRRTPRSFSPALSTTSFGSAVTPSATSDEWSDPSDTRGSLNALAAAATAAAAASPAQSDLSDVAERSRRRVVGGGWARTPPRAFSGAPRAASAQSSAGLAPAPTPLPGHAPAWKSHPDLRVRPRGDTPRGHSRPASTPRKGVFVPAGRSDDGKPRSLPSMFAGDKKFMRFIKRWGGWRRSK